MAMKWKHTVIYNTVNYYNTIKMSSFVSMLNV